MEKKDNKKTETFLLRLPKEQKEKIFKVVQKSSYNNASELIIAGIEKELNIQITEMEGFALFYIAKMLNKEAACIVTVVDSKYQKDKVITSKEREKTLDNMIELALNTSLKL